MHRAEREGMEPLPYEEHNAKYKGQKAYTLHAVLCTIGGGRIWNPPLRNGRSKPLPYNGYGWIWNPPAITRTDCFPNFIVIQNVFSLCVCHGISKKLFPSKGIEKAVRPLLHGHKGTQIAEDMNPLQLQDGGIDNKSKEEGTDQGGVRVHIAPQDILVRRVDKQSGHQGGEQRVQEPEPELDPQRGLFDQIPHIEKGGDNSAGKEGDHVSVHPVSGDQHIGQSQLGNRTGHHVESASAL